MKRCQNLSPGTHRQCERRQGHVSREQEKGRRGWHRAGWVDWPDSEGVVGPLTPIDSEMGPVPIDSEQELRTWWFNVASSEIDKTVPKAIEYGATDLIDIGVMLARTMRREVNEEEAAELGVFFYLIGKVARWQSAIERGERPSDDTLLDIGVYVRMAQRIRFAGGWPGTETK